MNMRALVALAALTSLSWIMPSASRAECDAVCMKAADAQLEMQLQVQHDIRDYRNALLLLDNAGASAAVKDIVLTEMAAMRDAFRQITNAPPLNAAPWNQPVGPGLRDLFGGMELGNVTRAEFFLSAKQAGYDGPLNREALKEWLATHPDQQQRMAGVLGARQNGYDGPFGGLDYMGYVCFRQGHCDADGRPLGPMTGHDLTEHSDGDPHYLPVAGVSGGSLTDVPAAGHATAQ
jgi:hypothetical protein